MDTVKLASAPVFFEKNRVFRVYLGGKLFSDFFGDNSEDGFYPEEWICSSTKALNEGSTDEFEGLSTIKGTNIHFNELLEEQKELMLGNRNGLDVLVKALDSAIRLPVQAHPDKEFSRKNFNSEFGKAESWLVLGAREDACIFICQPTRTSRIFNVYFGRLGNSANRNLRRQEQVNEKESKQMGKECK